MKLKISKPLKLSLLIVCPLFVAATAVYLFIHCNTPRFIEEQYTTYAFKAKSDVNYQVFLAPNILYEEKFMEEGSTYITEFIDYINTNFIYQLEGDKTAAMNGSYEIIAVMEGFTGTKDQYRNIWEKKEIILSPTAFEIQNTSLSINKRISINLKNYIAFVDEVMKQSKISASVKLRVQMNVNFTLESGQHAIEKIASPAIEIPLDAGYFTISKINVQDEPGKIDETRQIQLGADKKTILLCSVTMGILLLAILYLLLFAVELTEEDLYRKALNKIFKMHGSRFVALNSKISDTIQNCFTVRSIEDLVKIADELNKPVMYEYSADAIKIVRFYVVDESRSYVFELRPPYVAKADNEEESGVASAAYHF